MDSPTYHIFNLHCPVSIAMDFILDVTPLGSDTFVSGHWHTCPSFNETQLAESRLSGAEDAFLIHLHTTNK